MSSLDSKLLQSLALLTVLGETRPVGLEHRLGLSPGGGDALCRDLARRGLAVMVPGGLFRPTPAGRGLADSGSRSTASGRRRATPSGQDATCWQAAHGDLAVERRSLTDDQGRVTGVREGLVNRGGAPLDRYYGRRQLDADGAVNERRFRAGDRFRTDWFLGGLEPHLVRPLGMPGGGSGQAGWPGMTATDRQLAARGRWRDAVAALGPVLMPVAIGVCCDARLASDFGCSSRAASRQIEGLTALRLALDTLATHYP